MACLQFKPSRVVYRNIDFSRGQLRIFRKFLLGQCSKIIHLKEPFNQYHMSTKKIFDDMYLYLKEINRKHIDHLSTATLGGAGAKVDDLNGLPIDGYSELSSRFWNLIYKDPYRAEDDRTDMTVGPDILAIDDDIAGRRKANHGRNIVDFDFSKLSSDGIGGPNPQREAALNMLLDQASNRSVFVPRAKGMSQKRGSHAPGFKKLRLEMGSRESREEG
jgi:hypothetical protein